MNEERGLAELERRQYTRNEASHQLNNTQLPRNEVKKEKLKFHRQLRFYISNGPRRFAHHCLMRMSEFQGKSKTGQMSGTRVIWSQK